MAEPLSLLAIVIITHFSPCSHAIYTLVSERGPRSKKLEATKKKDKASSYHFHSVAINIFSYITVMYIDPIIITLTSLRQQAVASSSIPSAAFYKVNSLYSWLANHHHYQRRSSHYFPNRRSLLGLNASPTLCFRATPLEPLSLTVRSNGSGPCRGWPSCGAGLLFSRRSQI